MTTTTRRATTVATDWQKYANCATTDPDLFHPDAKGGGMRTQEIAAIRVCGNCLVRTECLSFALSSEQERGVWGGTTPIERRRMLAGTGAAA